LEVEPIDEKLKKKDLGQLGNGIDLLVKSNIIRKLNKTEIVTQQVDTEVYEVDTAVPVQILGIVNQPKLKVTKFEASKSCPLCGDSFFNKGNFTGCRCLEALGRFVKTELQKDDFLLKFDRKLDQDSIKTIIDALKSNVLAR